MCALRPALTRSPDEPNEWRERNFVLPALSPSPLFSRSCGNFSPRIESWPCLDDEHVAPVMRNSFVCSISGTTATYEFFSFVICLPFRRSVSLQFRKVRCEAALAISGGSRSIVIGRVRLVTKLKKFANHSNVLLTSSNRIQLNNKRLIEL